MAIDNPALWAIMKLGARNAMISTAEKAGIPWRQARQELKNNAEVSLRASCSAKAGGNVLPNSDIH